MSISKFKIIIKFITFPDKHVVLSNKNTTNQTFENFFGVNFRRRERMWFCKRKVDVIQGNFLISVQHNVNHI